MRPKLPDPADAAIIAATSRLIWGMAAAMLAAVCLGYWVAGLSLDLWSGRYIVLFAPPCLGLAWYYRRQRPDPWIAHGAESVAQVLVILILGTLLTYAAAATGTSYRDRELQAIDLAFGLDWRACLDFVNAHPWLGLFSNFVYFSMKPQTALIIGTLVMLGQFHRLQQFTLALVVTLMITIAVFAFVPAVGAFAHLGLAAADISNFAPSMTYGQMVQLEAIRGGQMHMIGFDRLEGLIAFPSFHTAAGILATWALWPCRRLRWWVLALNAAMIASTPVDGAHYFVDLPAGAAVAAAGIWAGKRLPAALLSRRWRPLLRPSWRNDAVGAGDTRLVPAHDDSTVVIPR
jgi:membrane-associated phospholipid phosphatase